MLIHRGVHTGRTHRGYTLKDNSQENRHFSRILLRQAGMAPDQTGHDACFLHGPSPPSPVPPFPSFGVFLPRPSSHTAYSHPGLPLIRRLPAPAHPVPAPLSGAVASFGTTSRATWRLRDRFFLCHLLSSGSSSGAFLSPVPRDSRPPRPQAPDTTPEGRVFTRYNNHHLFQMAKAAVHAFRAAAMNGFSGADWTGRRFPAAFHAKPSCKASIPTVGQE